MAPLALALLPLLPDVVMLFERLIGKKTSPADTSTGQAKLMNVVGVAQQIVSVLLSTKHVGSTPLTTEEIASLVNTVVQMLKPLGLDHLSTSPTGTLAGAAGNVITMPVFQISGTLTAMPVEKAA